MEISEPMRRAGWRECPSQDLLDWTSGFWMAKTPIGPMLRDAARMKWETEVVDKWPHRPVNPETWDYDPRGWGEQPAPITVAASVCVWDVLDRMIQDACVRNPDESGILKEVHAILYARYQVGLAEYGQPLMTHDGRDSAKDLSDEVADAWMYGMKLILEGREREGSRVMDLFIRAQNLLRVEMPNGND